MKSLGLVVGCVVLGLSLTACKKDPCAGADFKLAEPKMCMKLPPGAKADPAYADNGGQRITFRAASGKTFNLFWTESNHTKDVDGYITQNVGSAEVIGKGAVPGRDDAKYYFVKFKNNNNWGASTVYFQGKTRFYECSANTDFPSMGAMVEACKSFWAE